MRRPLPTGAPERGSLRVLLAALAILLGVGAVVAAARPGRVAAADTGASSDLPERLSDTGLYADLPSRRLAEGVRHYTPQYPLWTDGARKERWILLPPDASIGATDPDAWDFPVGTKLWKEFAFERRVETLYLERLPGGSWRLATYVWNAEGTDARLAPETGVRGAAESRPRVPYDVPGRADCLVCHGGRATPVLGFSALQLSPDRDPLAPHAQAPAAGDVDLATLEREGRLRGLPAGRLGRAPRIEAPTPRARVALGWLHANCGTCHTDAGPLASLDLRLDARASGGGAPPSALATALGHGVHDVRAERGHPHEGAAAVVAMAAAHGAPSPVERGAYVVDAFGCFDCHTPQKAGPDGAEPDRDRWMSGHPETLAMPPAPRLPKGPWLVTAAGTLTAWSGPWGTSFSTNLTPDPETGIGTWTEAQPALDPPGPPGAESRIRPPRGARAGVLYRRASSPSARSTGRRFARSSWTPEATCRSGPGLARTSRRRPRPRATLREPLPGGRPMKRSMVLPLLLAPAGVALCVATARGAPSPVERGSYLVNICGCADCHTPHKMGPKGPEPDQERWLSGHPETLTMPPAPKLPEGPWLLTGAATMTAWSGPWGTSFTANLTPDAETGLGEWTEDDFVAAMRKGLHTGTGRPILPPMPIPAVSQMSDEDLKSVFAYLKSIKPIRNKVPQPLPPGK